MKYDTPKHSHIIRSSILVLLLASCKFEKVNFSKTFTAEDSRALNYTPDSHERFGFSVSSGNNPDAWIKKGSTKLRLLNYSVDDNTDCYVSFLPGNAGGVLMNINRWRKQLTLDPVENLDKTLIPFAGKNAHFVDFNNNSKAITGIIQKRNDGLLFIKMTGPVETVEANKKAFIQFASSFTENSIKEILASDDSKTEQYRNLDWKIPGSWLLGPTKPMRNVTFVCGQNKRCEAYVTVLGGDGGGVLANINRWRKQLGLPETQDISNIPKFEVLGRQSLYVKMTGQFKGMNGESVEDAAIIGVIVDLRFQTLFVKLVGPKTSVLQEEKTFQEFLSSIHYKAAQKK